MKKRLPGNPKNPRTITEPQMAALKRSLAAFGDLGGIVFNRRTRRLVGGHQRAEAIDPQDITITETLKTPDDTGTVAWGYILHEGARYTYREVEWDEPTETAAMLAANKHGGTWDEDLLGELLAAMPEVDIDLSGFSLEEAADLKPVEAQSRTIRTGTRTLEDYRGDAIAACEKLRAAADKAKDKPTARAASRALVILAPPK